MTQFTKEQMKQALNQLVDMAFSETTTQPTKRLVESTPIVDPDLKKNQVEGKRAPFKSKAGNIVYPVDLTMIQDLLKEYKQLKDPNPKTGDVVEGILKFNSDALITTGTGVVTEAQLYRINLMCSDLNYDENIFMEEDQQ